MTKSSKESSSSDSEKESLNNIELLKRVTKLERKLKRRKHRRRRSRSNNSGHHGGYSRSQSRHRERSRGRSKIPYRRPHARSNSRRRAGGRTPSDTASARSPSMDRSRSPYRAHPGGRDPRDTASVDNNDNIIRVGRSPCEAATRIEHSAPDLSEPASNVLLLQDEELSEDIRNILGEDPGKPSTQAYTLHQAISKRWGHILSHGLPKDERDKLTNATDQPYNIWLVAPAINPELLTIVPPGYQTRDAAHSGYQTQLGSGIASLGKAINVLLDDDNDISRKNLLTDLNNTGRILSNLFNNISVTRRLLITPLLSKNMKEIAEKTVPDKLLFGPDLAEKIKTQKVLETTGKDLKAPQPVRQKSYKTRGGVSRQPVSQPTTALNRQRPVRRQRETRSYKGRPSIPDNYRQRRR